MEVYHQHRITIFASADGDITKACSSVTAHCTLITQVRIDHHILSPGRNRDKQAADHQSNDSTTMRPIEFHDAYSLSPAHRNLAVAWMPMMRGWVVTA